jgi:hypothetical protein
MAKIIQFAPINLVASANANFTLDTSTYVINGTFIHGKNIIKCRSHILLSEYDTSTGEIPDIELVQLFSRKVVTCAKLIKTIDVYSLQYDSATISLILPLYDNSEYIVRIEHKLLEVASRYDSLVKGNKKIASSYNEKLRCIEEKLNKDIATMRLEFNKDMSIHITLVEGLEAEVDHLNVRISKQSIATEERIKKIQTLTAENKLLTLQLDELNKLDVPDECSICLIPSQLISTSCCKNKCCVRCFMSLVVNRTFTCPYCRQLTS